MCKMIKRGLITLDKSKYSLSKYKCESDDIWLDSACYDAQQSLEFLMKGILASKGVVVGDEENDIPKNQGHNIRHLLSRLTKEGFTFDKIDDLTSLANTITSWEEEGRYSPGVHVHEQTLHRVYKIFDSMYNAYIAATGDCP